MTLTPADQKAWSSRSLPSWTQGPYPAPSPDTVRPGKEHCDLCGDLTDPDPGAMAVSGLTICPRCLEDMLDASTFDPRAEMGLVGKGGRR